jgi:hypothetical protein
LTPSAGAPRPRGATLPSCPRPDTPRARPSRAAPARPLPCPSLPPTPSPAAPTPPPPLPRRIPTRTATSAAGYAATGATIFDAYDTFKLHTGLPLRKRALGEAAVGDGGGETLNTLGMLLAQSAADEASSGTGRVTAANAAGVGHETGLAGSFAGGNLDTTFQTGQGHLSDGLPAVYRPTRPVDFVRGTVKATPADAGAALREQGHLDAPAAPDAPAWMPWEAGA